MTPALRTRPEPLPPRAVVGEGEVARRLAARLLALPEASRSQLRVIAVRGLVLAVGPEDALPWVDGVRYLGADASAPAMLLPTTLETTPSAVLVERALRRAHPTLSGPFALLSLGTLVPLARAAPVSRAGLAPVLEDAT